MFHWVPALEGFAEGDCWGDGIGADVDVDVGAGMATATGGRVEVVQGASVGSRALRMVEWGFEAAVGG